MSYGEFAAASDRAASAFAELGVARGDRVTLALGNSIEWLVAAFGALKAGGVLHPVNPALGASELRYILGHAEPTLVIVDEKSAEPVRRAAPERKLAAFDGAAGAVELRTAIANASPTAPAVALDDDDASMLLYTSGTTGAPKGVLMGHRSTGASAPAFERELGISPDDVLLFVTPLFHGNAWGAATTGLSAGATVAFPAMFRASEFWPLVHETKATVLFTLGPILAILLAREPDELEKKNPLRTILGLGAAPIRDRVIERFDVEQVAECFGSTDAGVVTLTPRGAAPRAGSAGPPLPDVRLRIVDDLGHDVATGEAGEILVASPNLMKEYFRAPAETAEALRDGWFHTGDLGRLDEDGWLYFVDRKRDVIRRGGENVSSVLVEKTLREHPAVVDVAVIGVPHEVLGQEIKAFVVTSKPTTADELRAFAAARLAKFQVPALWEFRDSLPKTATQRVEKYKLREESSGGGRTVG